MTVKCKDLKNGDTIIYSNTKTLYGETFEIFSLAKVFAIKEDEHTVFALPITDSRDSSMFIPFKNVKAVLNSEGTYKEFGIYNGFWYDVKE
jgi:hypothetical protein